MTYTQHDAIAGANLVSAFAEDATALVAVKEHVQQLWLPAVMLRTKMHTGAC